MFAPPRELHERFDAALQRTLDQLGRRHGFRIGGELVRGALKHVTRDPAQLDRVLGEFGVATVADVEHAVGAARAAFAPWRATPWRQRVALLRRAARLVDERLVDIAAALSLEVGKNRMEALGEVAEVSAFIDIYATQMEQHDGYVRNLPDDPVPALKSRNRSVLKPYGVWAVVSPFNYPFALAGGPAAAALIAGNTVVLKCALDTPWSALLLDQCLHDAGLPAGVFNFVVGDAAVGQALVNHTGIDGVTFTGSHAAGMQILRAQAARDVPRPCIAEMGGKNAVIVTERADLQVAAQGIVRSAYGMCGQKCSALSRIYVVERVAPRLIEAIEAEMSRIVLGIPQLESTWIGPVANAAGHERYRRSVARLREGASILAGARPLDEAVFGRGYYCDPVLAEAPLDHPLWREEMFAPIAMLARVPDAEQAMRCANDSAFGLTAGFYGGEDEVPWFFDHIEAGVTYANRALGATTGAWPGYQPFGGWKGSGSTGKALASLYYLPQYLREQSQTRIEP
ncbi:MAG: aldehyde dehydrogenase family protein [Ideonella sp.]|nr:aldehyde dehydrogenase family protein [Ideonella sp.]